MAGCSVSDISCFKNITSVIHDLSCLPVGFREEVKRLYLT